MSLQGLTHLTTCMVEFRFNRSMMGSDGERISQTEIAKRASAYEAAGHEAVHFYQTITTNFLFDVSRQYFDASREVIAAVKSRSIALNSGAFPELGAAFNSIDQRIWGETNGLRPIDLIEGAAVHATYRHFTSRVFCEHPDSAEGFEDYIWTRYRDSSRDHYTRAYRTARQILGHDAYFIFTKLTYLALCAEAPGETFRSLVAALSRLANHDLRDLSVRNLATLCGLDAAYCLPLGLASHGWFTPCMDSPGNVPYLKWLIANPIGSIHPILGPYLAKLLHPPDGFDLLNFAAEPLREGLVLAATAPTQSTTLNDFLLDLVPPLLIYKDDSVVCGLAKTLDNDYLQAIIHYMAMIGFVERLTRNPDVEMPCTHTACPVHASRLCWRYYAFPRDDYRRCTFPERAKELVGKELAVAKS